MTQRPDDINPFDPFGTARAMRDANIEAWSKAMQQFVNTEAYSQATGAVLDAYLTTSAPFRKIIEQTMTQVLQTYNMPTRSDVIRLAERLTNIEMRLDDLDAQITELQAAGQAQASEPQADTALPSAAEEEATARTMDPVVDAISEPRAREQEESAPSSKRRRTQKKEQ